MNHTIARLATATSLLIGLAVTAAAADVTSPWRPSDRIAISMDGNGGSARTNHKYTVADPDDIGASAVSLAIIAKSGLQSQLVHFDFNNWLDVGPVPEGKDRMTPSVLPAIERWGFDESVVFDLTKRPDEGVAHLTSAINASSDESRLFIVAAGPIESIYRAVADADRDKLQHVFIVSHSNYNERHLIQDDHRTIDDLEPYFENHGLGYIKIKDQNAKDDPYRLWHAGTNFEVWSFLKDSNDEDYRWLYERIRAHTYNKSDVSDAGMVFFLLQGDENGSPAKLEAFLGASIESDDDADVPASVTLTAENDFAKRDLPGMPPVYFDKARRALAVNAVKHKNVFAGAEATFQGQAGLYDVDLLALTELDGESEYRLLVDGTLIGKVKNPETDTDYKPHVHEFKSVRLNNGSVIRIESSSVSNGKIPEGDAFAFSRGRWRSLTFKPSAPMSSGSMIVIESESLASSSGWEERASDSASGGRYVVYTQYNSFKNVTPHRLVGQFEIDTPGRYTVKWLMRQPDDVPGDQANDAWLTFPDVQQRGKKELDGFNKFYGRSKSEFGFNGIVEVDHEHAWLTVEFPEAGTYTVELAGRSKGFELDCLVLFSGMNFEQAQQQLAQLRAGAAD
ncbi:MAG: hypothetical protein AAGI46_04855 [Planctomycetota bacterium]